MTDEAFAAALDDQRAYLRRVAWRMVGEAEAEDMAQEAIIKAWRAHARWDGRPLRPWLVAICRRECINLLRVRARRVVAGPLTGTEAAPDALAPALDRAALQAALARVNPPERAALVAYYLVGRPRAAIAAGRGQTRQAVSMQLYRGRRALAAALEA